ncbi:hypothetical protein IH879_12595 [candidate division KSB1 bacterium]|nr:hypothetical protein [candidate division KSB1 bacterium]
MHNIERSIVWICRHFNHEQILHLISELVNILENKNPEFQPKDDFKEQHPNYREFSTNPLAPLDSAEIIKPKKT